jgi:hypothetical protein
LLPRAAFPFGPGLQFGERGADRFGLSMQRVVQSPISPCRILRNATNSCAEGGYAAPL